MCTGVYNYTHDNDHHPRAPQGSTDGTTHLHYISQEHLTAMLAHHDRFRTTMLAHHDRFRTTMLAHHDRFRTTMLAHHDRFRTTMLALTNLNLLTELM